MRYYAKPKGRPLGKDDTTKDNKKKYHPWADGFKKGARLEYHPYTEIGFKFDMHKE